MQHVSGWKLVAIIAALTSAIYFGVTTTSVGHELYKDWAFLRASRLYTDARIIEMRKAKAAPAPAEDVERD